MRQIISLIILFAIIFGIYTYQADIKKYFNSAIKQTNTIDINQQIGKIDDVVAKITNTVNTQSLPVSKCDTPITYNIGNFDSKFGVTQDYFLKAIKEAEAPWEKASGKNLFQYNQDTGTMPINLVYDYRQETTDKLKDAGIVVQQNRASYEEVKTNYTTTRSNYLTAKKNYDTELANFNIKNAEFVKQVNYWNSQGGAPQDEYAKLNEQKVLLQAEATKINNDQLLLNQLVDQVNGLAVTLNKLASVLNLNVNNYNTIGDSLGDSFEEGLYKQDGDFRSIDIYEHQNYDQLVRVLTHELGHALGIAHLDDKNAIMYYLNLNKSLVLSTADKTALGIVCGLQPAQ